ncbi:HAMP domain-containing sensor histidine kinase [Spirosoma knui]
MNTRTRLAFLLVAYGLAILTLFGLSVYFFQNNYAYGDFYKRLETRATISARYNLTLDKRNAQSYRTIREKHLERLDGEKEYILSAVDGVAAGTLAETYQLPVSLVERILTKGRATAQEGTKFFAGVKVSASGRNHIVVVSANNYYMNHHLRFLRNVLGLGILLASIVTVYMSFYFSKHVFEPIKQITNRVRHISTENINLRLEEKEYRHEIGELTTTFNDLLNRIETSIEIQKNFIGNASHELATPLTSIIGEADVTLKKERQPAEYQLALRNILTQAERLNEITRSLLSLAQIGFNGKKLNFDIIRIDELIWEVKALLDKLNPHNHVQVDFQYLPEDPRKLKINGNRQLLQLALTNLLNNACKYSNNKPVTVHIGVTAQEVVLIIQDKGVGIPEEEIQFIYDPFFRASNTKLYEGYGIGLPLARNIIKLHNGLLHVSSRLNVGTTVRVQFPSIGPAVTYAKPNPNPA